MNPNYLLHAFVVKEQNFCVMAVRYTCEIPFLVSHAKLLSFGDVENITFLLVILSDFL